MRIDTKLLLGSREDVKHAIGAWMSGDQLSPLQQGFVDLALQVNAAEQACLTGSMSDRFESQTIEVGA